ncbi:MAG TPA: response regulator [Polyangiaceae bacterium]|nr:response regulator [Polyangiaceae bacterium]
MTSVMVVDDDDALRRALARDLERDGFTVSQAESAEQALHELERSDYDLVLTDLRMSQHSGLDLLRAVRANATRTATILMSAYATARDYEVALSLGSSAVLNKPFSRKELNAAVHQALEAREGFRGSLHGITLLDVLQMFHFGRRSISVQLSGARSGAVHLFEGEIIHAETAGLQGEIALRALLARQRGIVKTGPLQASIERSITRPFDSLVLDSLRENDENGAPNPATIPPPRFSWIDAPEVEERPSGPMSVRGLDIASVRSNLPQLPPAAERALHWLEATRSDTEFPWYTAAVAITLSSARTDPLAGDLGGELGPSVLEVFHSASVLTQTDAGYWEAIKPMLACALIWDRQADTALLLALDRSTPRELAWFRSSAGAVARYALNHQRKET